MSLRVVLPALWLLFAPPVAPPAPAPAPAPKGAPAVPAPPVDPAPTPDAVPAPPVDPAPTADPSIVKEELPGDELDLANPVPAPTPAPEAEVEPDPDAIQAAPAPSANADAPITVTTRLTPEPAHIGDVLTLEVIVAYPRGYSINLPSSLDFSPLQRVEGDIQKGEVESTGNDLRQRFSIELQYFDVGEAEVPSFPVTYVDEQAEVHTYLVDPHPFEIERLLGNESDPQPKGEDPMISLEYPNVRLATIIWSVLAGVVAAGILAGLLLWWRRRERPVVLPPPIPPHERAYAALEELAKQREELIAEGAYQDYYLRLTDIAKRYLGDRFGFDASDRTTEEIQDLLRGRVSIEPLDPKTVLMFLQDCDLVKFARLSPPEDEAREALEVVRGMVDDSAQLPGEAVEGGEGKPGSGQGEQARATAERPDPLPESEPEPEPKVDPDAVTAEEPRP